MMQALARLGRLLRTYGTRRGADDLDAAYVSHQSYIVVGGCGRSGTTLARVILDSHPDICCGPESSVFLSDVVDLEKLQDKFKLDGDALLTAYQESHSRAEFIDQFAKICCRMTGKSRWAEKTPRNVLHLEYLFARFPEARFVHMLRDGRDVACSLRTHPRHRVVNGKLVPVKTWKPMEECATRWRDSLLAAKPFWNDSRLLTVRYEELVAEPRATISRLLEFVSEPWDDAVLAHHEAESEFRDATKFPQNPEALRPIGATAIGRWERDMTARDREAFKRLAGDLLVECGYAADDRW
jgi:protein-tyrosine sulfotransferase